MRIRTDLAIEARDMMKETEEINGVVSYKEEKEDVVITTVDITNDEGAKIIGKPEGRYITIESNRLKNLDPDESECMSYFLKDELLKLLPQEKAEKILIAGLGNRNITPDALGPEVVSKIMVTSHLKKYIPELIDEELSSVCAISPGVMGITGIETGEIISGIVNKVKPGVIIAIDALASRSPTRISRTIQLTDTGIIPGSGVGNTRKALNRETLGVPVISIGVPMVVDAVSLAFDVMKKASEIFTADEIENKVFNSLKEEELNYMVTPKEIDNIINHISNVIANGINLALHPGIDMEYIENFVY